MTFLDTRWIQTPEFSNYELGRRCQPALFNAGAVTLLSMKSASGSKAWISSDSFSTVGEARPLS
jgi:hypothetical protein